MSHVEQDRAQAQELPEGDVVRVLLLQHARIRELFDAVRNGPAARRQEVFQELRALLAVHEAAEEMIVRPVAERVAGEQEAAARNAEEKQAVEVLVELDELEVGSARFGELIAGLQRSVDEHAEKEEREEFPALLRECGAQERARLGRRLLAVEEAAPTHPHPTAAGSTMAQWALGPFASVVDRARDAVSSTAGAGD